MQWPPSAEHDHGSFNDHVSSPNSGGVGKQGGGAKGTGVDPKTVGEGIFSACENAPAPGCKSYMQVIYPTISMMTPSLISLRTAARWWGYVG